MNRAQEERENILRARGLRAKNYVLGGQHREIGRLVFDAVDVDISPRSFFNDDDGERCSLRAVTFEFGDRSRLRVILEEDASLVSIADAVVLPSKGEY